MNCIYLSALGFTALAMAATIPAANASETEQEKNPANKRSERIVIIRQSEDGTEKNRQIILVDSANHATIKIVNGDEVFTEKGDLKEVMERAKSFAPELLQTFSDDDFLKTFDQEVVITCDKSDGIENMELQTTNSDGKQRVAISRFFSSKPRLGIHLGDKESSATITHVIPNSVAERSGLQQGDKILSIGGKSVANDDEAIAEIRKAKNGEKTEILVLRNKEKIAIAAEFDSKQEPAFAPSSLKRFSQTLANPYSNKRFRWVGAPESACETPCKTLQNMRETPLLGVYVTATENAFPTIEGIIEQTGAQEAKLQAGDVLLEVDGSTVKSYTQLRKAVSAHKPGERIPVTYGRNGDRQTIYVKLSDFAGTKKLMTQRLEKQCAELQSETAAKTANAVDESESIGSNALTVSPNPASGFAVLRFAGSSEPAAITISNLEGRTLTTKTLASENGDIETSLDLTGFARGSYFVSVEQGGKKYMQQLVVE